MQKGALYDHSTSTFATTLPKPRSRLALAAVPCPISYGANSDNPLLPMVRFPAETEVEGLAGAEETLLVT